mmetsp:Transcript_100986/g.324238  ORF Transcript_100986/g.324238 Transcript_100986/m.324238 type:complete len:624 (-) Transcript_100986:256-2127(-)
MHWMRLKVHVVIGTWFLDILPCLTEASPPKTSKHELEVVISQYKESISWSDGYTSVRTIYCKAEDPAYCAPGSVLLPNVGREGHTFLHHIVENYDNLATWTVFTQAEEPSDGYNGQAGGHMLRGATLADYVIHPHSHDPASDDPEVLFLITSKFHMPGLGHSLRTKFQKNRVEHTAQQTAQQKVQDKGSRPPVCPSSSGDDKWAPWSGTRLAKFLSGKCSTGPGKVYSLGLTFWADYVQLPLPVNEIFYYAQGARFAASRDRIRGRPKEHYEKLLHAMAAHIDPCLGYFVEYFWWYLIGLPTGNPCPTEPDDGNLFTPAPLVGKLPCLSNTSLSKDELEIVLSQYDESAQWSDECKSVRTIYCKAENLENCAPDALHLPNVGREGHTFLHHIVENYDKLAKWTVFSQAEVPTEGYDGKQGGHLLTGATFADYVNHPNTCDQASDDPEVLFLITSKVHLYGLGKSLRSIFRTGWDQKIHDQGSRPAVCPGSASYDQWSAWKSTPLVNFLSDKCSTDKDKVLWLGLRFWKEYVQLQVPFNQILHYAQGSRFAASRDRIRQRPKEEYEKVLQAMALHKDPCLGYFVEYFWYYLIGRPANNPCPTDPADRGLFTAVESEQLPHSSEL